MSGLTSPVSNYSFKVKGRNPADIAHAVSSESNFSTTAAITNTAPTINIISVELATGTGHVLINYIGTDTQNDTNNITVYEYSTDNVVWHTMTQRPALVLMAPAV